MAKKKKTKEQRQADRKQKQVVRQEDKKQQAADFEKVKAADASYKASKKSKKEAEKQQRRRGVGDIAATPAVDAPPVPAEEPRVMHITADPETGQQTEALYRNIGEYTKENPESVTTTLSGKDPKTETIHQIANKQKSYNADEVNELANAVGDDVAATEKDVKEKDFQLNVDEKARNEKKGEEPRAYKEGLVDYDEGAYVGDIAAKGTGQPELTDEQYAKLGADFRRGLAAAQANAPSAAIEKMGIEHYYPPQQDFITANFTGSYIGSRQLVAGTGALFPVGLLDARKRAKEAKAKKKAEDESKFWELGATATQYDERYKDIGMDILEKYYDLAGGNIDDLMNSNSKLGMQLRRDMYDYESRGKHLLEVHTNIKAIIDKLNTGEGEEMYVPPSLYDAMKDFADGTTDLDAYIKGETIGDEQIKAISNMVRGYQNFTPLANKQLELLKGQADKMPLRQDVDWTDPVNAANLQEAISNSGSTRDWTAYTKVMGQYYDIGRVKEIVENMHRSGRLWEGGNGVEREDIIQDEMRYMMSMLGTQVDIEQEFKATNALGWDSERRRQSELDWKKKTYRDQWKSMWEGLNDEMNTTEMTQDALNVVNSIKDPKLRAKKLAEMLAGGGSSGLKKTPATIGGVTVAAIPTRGITNESVNPQELMVMSADGKRLKPITEMMEFYEKASIKHPENDYYKTRYNELQKVYGMKGGVQHQVGGRYAGYSYNDAEAGGLRPIEYAPENVEGSDLVNTAYYTGKLGIPELDKDNKPIMRDGEVTVNSSIFNYVSRSVIESREFHMSAPREQDTQEGRNRYYLNPNGELVLGSESEGQRR
jgi:hypothetical protein